MKHSSIVAAFALTCALLAAALGDGVVEGISNANVLWHGQYTDGSSIDLLPTLLVAILALTLTVGLWMRAQARATRLSARSILVSTSRCLTIARITRLLPVIFALQVVVLLIMETTEQLVVDGSASGGTLWLGGPVVMSLLIHAVFSVLCSFCVAGVLHVLARALSRIVTSIFAHYLAVARLRLAGVTRPRRIVRALELVVMHCGVQRRGPPVLALAHMP